MQEVKRMKLEDRPTLYPVLPDDLEDVIPLTEVFIDTISDPKDISKVIVELNSIFPIPELTHLKRVKGRDILLFPTNNVVKDEVYDLLKQRKFNTSYLKNNIRTVMVAKVPPKVRKQYEKVQQIWPCNFHSNKYLEKLSTNTLFSENELQSHARFMAVAIDVAKYASEIYFRGSQIGAVIVDPKIDSIVAVGYRNINEGPCRHAVMVAVDNVSKTQNGGAWNTVHHSDQKDTLNFDGFPKDILDFLRHKYQTLRFGATSFNGKSVGEPADGPYLCTGYYVYVTHEPCIMCAMTLIHSRAKRVFYGARSSNGALQTLCKIHTIRDLNHHYEVFGGLLENDCCALLK